MSRAFVKEPQDGPPETALPARRAAVPITAAGMQALRAALERAVEPARRAELEGRIATSVVGGPPADPARVGFGATVAVSGPASREAKYTIVGEDEVDVENGRIGPTSPLALALQGKRAGERVVWHRPAGDRKLTIRSVRYGGHEADTLH